MTRLAVYVPADKRLRGEIWKGSGIVGSPVEGTRRLRLDFEGDVEAFPSIESRVRRAAERHLWEDQYGTRGYPTSAMAYASREAVARVGWWNVKTKSLEVTDPTRLAKWIGEDSQ